MLRYDKTRWTVTCATCGAVGELPDAATLDEARTAATLDEARTAATKAAWMDQARKGVGVAKWEWLCPECRPRPGNVMGRST